jgi:folate-binding protein YgfZ
VNSTLRAAQQASGASFVTIAGAEVARHYGDGGGEYTAVREAAGIAVRSDLATLRMWGRDPARMLHGLVTNDITTVTPEQGTYATMLTPKGRTIAEMRVLHRAVEPAELVLLLPREALEGASAHFRKFVPPMFARWADVSDEFGIIGIYGPAARELIGQVLGGSLPDEREEATSAMTTGDSPCPVTFSREIGGEPGFDLIAPITELPALWERLVAAGEPLGARPVGFGALEALRIEAGRPRYGAELTEETIPTEAFESIGWMPRAISFTKGCYTGQEVIVRIAHRGHVNRLLRGLLLGDSPSPASRAPVVQPETGKVVGWITSTAVSPRLGQTIAMCYLRRELVAGQQVRLHDAEGPLATVVDLPFVHPQTAG